MKRDRTSPFENRTSGTNVSANGTGDESRMRKRVRAAVDAGRLPDRRPDRMWGGPGAGAICPICEGLVDHNETEIEVEIDPPDEVGFHVHSHCFEAWE